MFICNSLRKVFMLIIGITSIGLFHTASADYDINAGGISKGDDQDVVISLKSNPMSNPEAACLAVTFARSLSMANGEKNVTLFVTLDGVSLADSSVVGSPRFKCETPWEEEISLIESLELFIGDNNNNMVVCPICWNSRYGDTLPDYGVLPGKTAPVTAIGAMIFNADKILDF